MLNRIFETMIDAPVEIGSPATIILFSDRRPCIVTGIVRFKGGTRAGQPKEVTVREVEVTPKPWPNGYAETIHLDRPTGGERAFTVRKDGRWRDAGGTFLKIGKADYYYDPSF